MFDARGRQKSQTDRNSGTTSFAYFATGQLQSLTDAESQTTSYTYDDAGGKLTEQYPDHTGGTPGQTTYGIVTFTNDAAGRVLRKQDQKGDTCTMNYDLAGRMTSKNYRTLANSPSGTIADTDSFTYDKAGRMLTAVSGRYVNTVTYTFDSAGRKKTEGLTISGQTYTTTTGYNAKGELTSYSYPDGTAVGRNYTDRGELYQLTHAGTTIDTRVYDNGGRMTSSTYNNGVSETRAYGTDNTLASINFSGASIGNLSYGWDANKNKTSEAIAGTMSNYGFTVPTNGYDSEDRLVGFNRTSGLTQSWSLSAVGDWNSVTTNSSTETRTHGPTHELLTAGGQNISTDTKGNITLIPSALRPNSNALLLNWDFDNRLNPADVGNNSSVDLTYKFDALGRRVFRDDGTSATIYVQAGQQTIADYTSGTAASSPTYRYVYASYIDEPVLRYKPSATESLYYHRNQQYSVVAVTNASATIVERYAYSAYGVPTITNASGTVLSAGSVDNRYMYTGREWDSVIAQYHYRARIYDANLGRFASRDPIEFSGSRWNLFSYVENSPISYVDPSGFARGWPKDCADALSRAGLNYAADLARHLRKKINAYRGAGGAQDQGHFDRIRNECDQLAKLLELLKACCGPLTSDAQLALDTAKPVFDQVMNQCNDPNLKPPRNPVPVSSPSPVKHPAPNIPIIPMSPISPLSPIPAFPTPTRPWWPRIPLPSLPAFPVFIMPIIDFPEITIGGPMQA